MSSITESAQAFFTACEEGKGWDVCSVYCTPKSPDRKGLSGRDVSDSKGLLKPNLEAPCGPQPLGGSIAAMGCDTKLT
jgi:hypothetical protein